MNKKQVLFFVGQDITAHLVMNAVLKGMEDQHMDYEPVVYYAKNTVLKGTDLPALREFGFFEKTLLNETVYPLLDKAYNFCQPNLSPQQLADKYGYTKHDVDDVNDPAFVEQIKNNPNIACAVSVRCTQIFRPEIVAAVKRTGPFLNLHSGILPEYRGVMPTLRRMFDIATGAVDQNTIGCTLHKVDGYNPNATHKGIDTGKIIHVQTINLDPSHSGYQAGVSIADLGGDLVIDALRDLQKGRQFHELGQESAKAEYFTFPSPVELAEWKREGIVLVRPNDAITTLVNAFSKAGNPHAVKLEEEIRKAIHGWYSDNCACGGAAARSFGSFDGCAEFRADHANTNNQQANELILPMRAHA